MFTYIHKLLNRIRCPVTLSRDEYEGRILVGKIEDSESAEVETAGRRHVVKVSSGLET